MRASIIDLICTLLDRRRELLDAWELAHLADAVSALSLNVNALHQPSSAWLRLCLNDLELALKPPPRRSSIDTIYPIPGNAPTYAQLRSAVLAIAAEVGHPLG